MFKPQKETKPTDNMITVYADGAHRSSTDVSAYSYYLQYKSLEKIGGVSEMGATNNQMEITAVLKGLQSIKKPSMPVKVITDSRYVVDCMNKKWYNGWIRNGWKNSKGDSVKNKELWLALIEEIERFTFLSFEWVRGHSINNGNIKVDEHCNQLMDELELNNRLIK